MIQYDVVVMGAGLGGLISALSLAKAGKKVAVIEKHFKVGGYATDFIRKDKENRTYIFDVALHGIGDLHKGRSLYNCLEALELTEELNFLRKKETSTILCSKGEIDIPDDFDEYKKVLMNLFPENRRDIQALFDTIWDLEEDMNAVYQKKKAPKYINDYGKITLYEFLKRYTDNEELIETFSYLWLYYGLPCKALNAYYYLMPWLSYHIGGTYYIEGGSQKLSNRIAEKIKVYGGEIILSHEVVQVELSENKVSKIVTKKGAVIEGENYIINGDPNVLLSLVSNPNNNLVKYKEKLDGLEVGTSLSQLYIGLDCLPCAVGIEKSDYFIMENEGEVDWQHINQGEFEKMGFGITNYNQMDKSLNKEVGVICITIGDNIKNWPERTDKEYKVKKEEVTRILLKKLYKYFPKVEGHVTLTELGTPQTMKRYTNNSKGAVYGWAQNTSQGAFDRLALKTPLDNLYLAGSWSQPGGGFQGAILSGYDCSKLLLKNEKNKVSSSEKRTDYEPDMPINAFMVGMVAGFNKELSKGIAQVYQFIFDEKDVFYIEVKNEKAKLYNGKEPMKADIVVKTSYVTWYQIGQGIIEGEDALRSGDLKIEGDIEVFMNIPMLFKEKQEEKTLEKQLFNGSIYLTLTMIPWIFYWAGREFLSNEIISLVGVVATVLIMLVIKPKSFKEATKLEGVTLVAFSLYGTMPHVVPEIYSTLQPYMMDVIFIATWVISAFSKVPLTAEYSKYTFKESMVRTKLFQMMNKHITLMWSLIFIIQAIIIHIIHSPIKNMVYILVVVGIVISEKYPKYKLTHI